jgi:hypothetical protein
VKKLRALGVTWAKRAAKAPIGTIGKVIGTKHHS